MMSIQPRFSAIHYYPANKPELLPPNSQPIESHIPGLKIAITDKERDIYKQKWEKCKGLGYYSPDKEVHAFDRYQHALGNVPSYIKKINERVKADIVSRYVLTATTLNTIA